MSWKAQVFADAAAARAYDEHTDDLTFARVLMGFRDDFAARGTPLAVPDDPLHDPAFVRTLARAHQVAPTVYPWGPAT